MDGYSITTKAMKLSVPANACGIRGLYILQGNCVETQHLHVLQWVYDSLPSQSLNPTQ